MNLHRRTLLCSLAALAAPALLSPRKVHAAALLGFDEMYGPSSVLGLTFSDKMKSLDGQTVAVRGFMAPPLKADADFLVLTRSPVSLCPFCNSDEDWPDSIIVVYLENKGDFVQANHPIEVTGVLELGSKTDAETGFVSLVRLVDAHYEVIK